MAACNIKTVHVLRGNGSIGTDIDHVNTVSLVMQVLQGEGDHTSRHQSLAEADLIGYQEAAGGRVVEVEALKDGLGSAPLEVLQPCQHRSWVEALAFHVYASKRAAVNTAHSSRNSGGTTSPPSVVPWSLSTTRPTSYRRSGFRLNARVSSSSNGIPAPAAPPQAPRVPRLFPRLGHGSSV